MPNNIVKSYSKKTGRTVEEIEKLWNKALTLSKKSKSRKKKGKKSIYRYSVGILKKMLSLKENFSFFIDRLKILSEV
jgi:hypothetical protein